MRVHAHTYPFTGSADSTATPIIASAGIGKSVDSWDVLQRAMTDRFSFTGWDMLGHGQSPTPEDPQEYTRDRAVDDLDDVVKSAVERQGTDSFRAPRRVRPLAGRLPHAGVGCRSLRCSTVTPRGCGPCPAPWCFLRPVRAFATRKSVTPGNARSRRNAHRFGVAPQAAELNCQEDGMVIERVAALEIPTLLMVGSEDRPEIHGGCGYLAKKMPNAEMVTIAGGDHLMHEDADHSVTIAAAIAAFVDGVA